MADSTTGKIPNPELSKLLKELYTKGDYDAYIKKLSLSKDYYREDTYHYNLGTAYLKKGELAASRYHLEKSVQNGALQPGVYKNLDTVLNRLELGTLEGSRYMTDRTLSYALDVPGDFFLTLALALGVVWTSLLRFKKISRRFFAIALIFCLSPLCFWFFVESQYGRAIVLEDALSFEGPSRSFEASSDIPGGTAIIIKRNEGSGAGKRWLYIKAPTHFSGWIESAKVGIL